jgi:hypothetical protein
MTDGPTGELIGNADARAGIEADTFDSHVRPRGTEHRPKPEIRTPSVAGTARPPPGTGSDASEVTGAGAVPMHPGAPKHAQKRGSISRRPEATGVSDPPTTRTSCFSPAGSEMTSITTPAPDRDAEASRRSLLLGRRRRKTTVPVKARERVALNHTAPSKKGRTVKRVE